MGVKVDRKWSVNAVQAAAETRFPAFHIVGSRIDAGKDAKEMIRDVSPHLKVAVYQNSVPTEWVQPDLGRWMLRLPAFKEGKYDDVATVEKPTALECTAWIAGVREARPDVVVAVNPAAKVIPMLCTLSHHHMIPVAFVLTDQGVLKEAVNLTDDPDVKDSLRRVFDFLDPLLRQEVFADGRS